MSIPASSQPRGPAEPPIAPNVQRQAAQWLAELQSDEVSELTRARWLEWRNAHPEHDRAWRRVESFGLRLQTLPSALAHAALAPPVPAGRRRAIKTLVGVFTVGGVAWLAREATPWPQWTADMHTGVAQRSTFTLADGTIVALNAGAAINVRFTASERVVHLVAGEIMVTTAHDPEGREGRAARPFLVKTTHGSLRALGTRFSVEAPADIATGPSRVAVFEGAVEVTPAQAGARPLILRAGERGRFDGMTVTPEGHVDDGDAAWVDGMIVARDMPLPQFLARVAPYRRGWLMCDPSAAQLTVSGTYPLADTDRVLDMLVTALPIRVQFVTRYWVTVRAL